MSYQEILSEIKSLTSKERFLLLEALSRLLREEHAPLEEQAAVATRLHGIANPEGLGMLKPIGHIPNDDEVEEILVNALMEKHLK